jgi:hypothetical protein
MATQAVLLPERDLKTTRANALSPARVAQVVRHTLALPGTLPVISASAAERCEASNDVVIAE